MLVLLVDSSLSRQTLPRQFPLEEVHEDVTESLHIVSPGLFDSDVGVNTGVSGSACERLAIFVLNVLAVRGHELLRESEVD